MERLALDNNEKYQSIEGAIHLNRYLIARDICKNKRVLDAACGEGYGSYLLKRWGAKSVVGLDISDEAVKNAKKQFADIDILYDVQNVEKLSRFSTNEFDLTISLETIEHLENPVVFLNELRRVTKLEGQIIISCPNDYFYYPTEDQCNPYHLRKYTFNEFKEMCCEVLGSNARFFYGTPSAGYTNILANDYLKTNRDTDHQLEMMNFKSTINSVLLPHDHDITADNCSYFIGIWGDNDTQVKESVACYPNAMSVYPNYYVDSSVSSKEYKLLQDKIADYSSLQEKVTEYESLHEKMKECKSVYEEENTKLRIQNEKAEHQLESLQVEMRYLKDNYEKLSVHLDELTQLNCSQKHQLQEILGSRGYAMLSVWYRLKDRIKG